jgi:putative CocE/NonD family hydrolase
LREIHLLFDSLDQGGGPVAISRRQRLADAFVGRALRQVPARTSYDVSPVHTPMRDGTVLLGDHYGPTGSASRGTVLIRTPYGRGFPTSALNGRLLAARGYHVLLQSVRGTFGSGGRFEPMAQETADGQDTVAWLRTQSWFDGRLATLGGSYMGWTQWAILQDPPPELRTAVVYVGPHDFRASTYGTGAFTLGDFLGWSYQITRQEDGSGLRRVVDTIGAGRKLAPVYAGLPLPEAAETVLHGQAPWYREWATRVDGSDPWWEPYRAGASLSRVTTPVLLAGGWQDLFLEQTVEQYTALAARGVEVGLTVGPWTHLDLASRAARQLTRESIAWLDQHMAGGPPARHRPVQVFRTGERRWHELSAWPPASAPAIFKLHPTGTLTLSHPTATPVPDVPPLTSPTADAVPDVPPPTSPAPNAEDAGSPEAGDTASPAAADAGDPEAGEMDDRESAEPRNPRSEVTLASDFVAGDDSSPAGPISPGDSPVTNESAISDTSAESDKVGFWYDPADPTPSLGGRTLSGSMGVKDNRPLENRSDVRSFTTDPLPTAVDVIGSPVLDLAFSVDSPHADVFVRLCDVVEHGHSRNFSDLMHRLDPTVPPGQVHHLTLTLDPCFHRLRAGHRLRLLVTGGAFPRYARALPDSGRLTPSHRTIHCSASSLTLPIATPQPAPELP